MSNDEKEYIDENTVDRHGLYAADKCAYIQINKEDIPAAEELIDEGIPYRIFDTAKHAYSEVVAEEFIIAKEKDKIDEGEYGDDETICPVSRSIVHREELGISVNKYLDPYHAHGFDDIIEEDYQEIVERVKLAEVE